MGHSGAAWSAGRAGSQAGGSAGRESPSLRLWVCRPRDLSMILCDPFAINTLSLSTVRHLQELVGQEVLPRVSAPGQPPAAVGRDPGVSPCFLQAEGTWA